MRDFKRLLYLALVLGLLLYAVPRLDIGGDWTAATVFAVVWIGFALLIVAAQLHFILGVDRELKDELKHVKQMKRRQMEKVFSGQGTLFSSRK